MANESFDDKKGITIQQQSNDLLEAITKGANIIIATIDKNFCYTFFNEAYRDEVKKLSGMDIHLGSSMIETFSHLPEQQMGVIEQWNEVLNGKLTNKRLEFGEPGIYQRTYDVLHTPIRDCNGNIVGAGEVAYDVTERLKVIKNSKEATTILKPS